MERKKSKDHALLLESQCFLRKRLSPFGNSTVPTQYGQQRTHLKDLIWRTATMGESNSVLLIGARGSGKSALLQDVLNELFQKSEVKANLLQVDLTGLVHTDDRITLKDITRQLQLETVVGDHVFGSFAQNLTFLLESLKSGGQQSKSILFIMDEFDLFCQHKNQTLLYNLFDIAQSAQTPVVIVGLTCRLDVVELLEKRVKSRFSHRQLHLFNQMTFDDYVDLARQLLILPRNICSAAYRTQWNTAIEDTLKTQEVTSVLRRLFDTSRDIRVLKNFLFFLVGWCNQENHGCFTVSDFIQAQAVFNIDSKAAMLQGLSLLELTLIVSMMHLTSLYEEEPFNFEMVYTEYLKFSHQKSSMRNFQRAVVLKAFEKLKIMEFVMPTKSSSCSQQEFQMVRLLVEPIQIMEALQRYPGVPTELQQWATSSFSHFNIPDK